MDASLLDEHRDDRFASSWSSFLGARCVVSGGNADGRGKGGEDAGPTGRRSPCRVGRRPVVQRVFAFAPPSLPRGRWRPARMDRAHPEAQRPRERRRPRGAGARLARHHERRAGLAREPRQPHGHGARQRRGGVEHHEREGAAAQQHVRAPGGARRILGAHDPEPSRRGGRRPVARRQGAARVDHRHPPPVRDRARHELAEQGGPPPAAPRDDLGEPAARHPASGEGVQLGEPRRQRRNRGRLPHSDLQRERGAARSEQLGDGLGKGHWRERAGGWGLGAGGCG